MLTAPDQAVVDQVKKLTRREREIAALVGRGRSRKQIASDVGITVCTTAAHIKSIHKKLGTNQMSLASWATRTGLVDHPEWFDENGYYMGARP